MIFKRQKIRFINFILIASLLTCTAPAHKTKLAVLPRISVEEAKEKLRGLAPVRLKPISGLPYTGYLMGWDERGFIRVNSGKIDTLKYGTLTNRIEFANDKNQAAKGASIGGTFGALAFVVCAILIFSTRENRSEGFGTDETLLFLIGVPILVAGGASFGAIIGSTQSQYDNFIYDKHEFETNPWRISDVNME
jgi:hypothetical protein